MSGQHGEPRKFVRGLFDLGYGAEDEKLSRDEIRAQLKESGVDPDAAWQRTAKLLAAAKGKLRLEDARAARLAAEAPSGLAAAVTGVKDRIVREIEELFAAAGPGAAMYARNWKEAAEEDLIALRDQLKRTIDREARRPKNGK